ncbi:class A beta-lactamase [Jeongeupia chitinilytica]|uniref:Beta-lactamase n=1 Tax=Jeongeupia chitinilytica TaxID=1041641 RepID=A0ABQ3GXG0_9NEIS|nr:class A beta-lactamase [Jeongeupia chitinilytica]GHD55610.1 beta-lactamase [Jeongeupia chitinilytica]
MSHSPERRRLLLAAASLPFALALKSRAATMPVLETNDARFAELERRYDGRLGVSALDTGSGARLGYRMDERFAFCSTFKAMLAGAILARSVGDAGLLQRRIRYTQADLVSHSPVSGSRVVDGMTVAELCAAAIRYSDNTAANLLIRQLGAPADVTAFARSIGDDVFRLDRWETELNTALPGDLRDTTTPAAMARSLQALTLGDALPVAQRVQLQEWLRGNTTGAKRIRAGVPDGWSVGDKTGSGDYGTTNDIAVLWPPGRMPIVLAVYFTRPVQDAGWADAAIADAARLVVKTFVRTGR